MGTISKWYNVYVIGINTLWVHGELSYPLKSICANRCFLFAIKKSTALNESERCSIMGEPKMDGFTIRFAASWLHSSCHRCHLRQARSWLASPSAQPLTVSRSRHPLPDCSRFSMLINPSRTADVFHGKPPNFSDIIAIFATFLQKSYLPVQKSLFL